MATPPDTIRADDPPSDDTVPPDVLRKGVRHFSGAWHALRQGRMMDFVGHVEGMLRAVREGK